jgi:hypothetical protein
MKRDSLTRGLRKWLAARGRSCRISHSPDGSIIVSVPQPYHIRQAEKLSPDERAELLRLLQNGDFDDE